jgi:hypothetical protein
MKGFALCCVVVLIETLALCPVRARAQAAAEYGVTTSAVGTLGTKIGSALGSALGGANKQASQTVLKAPLSPAPSTPAAKPKGTVDKSAKTGPNTLHLDSTPSAASIYIDNVASGQTPANVTLAKGIHVIELRHQGFTSWQKTILLTEGEKLSFSPALKDPKTSHPMFTVQR